MSLGLLSSFLRSQIELSREQQEGHPTGRTKKSCRTEQNPGMGVGGSWAKTWRARREVENSVRKLRPTARRQRGKEMQLSRVLA